jgi:hypothetical protein
MAKNIKLKSTITIIILMGYILNIFFAYRILQSTNIITVWNKVISITFILNIVLNGIMTIYTGIETKKEMNKSNIAVFMANKVMFVCVIILFVIGYFLWKNQV